MYACAPRARIGLACFRSAARMARTITSRRRFAMGRGVRQKRKGSERWLEALWELTRRRPTLPHGRPCSTIGSEELDFRVRDGIGYGLLDIATGIFRASFAAASRSERHRDAVPLL